MSISYGWEWTIRDTNGELLEVTPIGFLQSSFNSYPNKHGEDASEVGLKLWIDSFDIDIDDLYNNGLSRGDVSGHVNFDKLFSFID